MQLLTAFYLFKKFKSCLVYNLIVTQVFDSGWMKTLTGINFSSKKQLRKLIQCCSFTPNITTVSMERKAITPQREYQHGHLNFHKGRHRTQDGKHGMILANAVEWRTDYCEDAPKQLDMHQPLHSCTIQLSFTGSGHVSSPHSPLEISTNCFSFFTPIQSHSHPRSVDKFT